MAPSRGWKIALAVVLVGFWVWRMMVTPVPVGLVLYATSAGLLLAGMLLLSAWTDRRARERDGHIYPVEGREGGSA